MLFDPDDLLLVVLLIVVTVLTAVVTIVLLWLIRIAQRRGDMRRMDEEGRPGSRLGPGISLATPQAIRDTLEENGEGALTRGIDDTSLREASERILGSSAREVESLWESYVDLCRLIARSARAEKRREGEKDGIPSDGGHGPEGGIGNDLNSEASFAPTRLQVSVPEVSPQGVEGTSAAAARP